MQHRNLGSGLRVSAVGLGGNNFGRACTVTMTQEAADAVVDAALEAGVNLIDTADVYGAEYGASETLLGVSLHGRRDEVVIATKFGHADMASPLPRWGARGSRRYIRWPSRGPCAGCSTDWIDLYQLHPPDPATPIEETLSALDDLVAEGKIRYFGHSNLAGWQIADADWTAPTSGRRAFISAQNEYSLLERERRARGHAGAATQFGLGLLPYFPLANGLLTGKYRRGEPPAELRIAAASGCMLTRRAVGRGSRRSRRSPRSAAAPARVAIGGLAAQPGSSSVIAGATRPEQVRQNAAAADVAPLTPDERARIVELFPA